MMEWIGIVVKGLFYATLILITAPVLILFRVDQHTPSIDDGTSLEEPDE